MKLTDTSFSLIGSANISEPAAGRKFHQPTDTITFHHHKDRKERGRKGDTQNDIFDLCPTQNDNLDPPQQKN